MMFMSRKRFEAELVKEREAAAALRAVEHKAFLDALTAVAQITTASADAVRETAATLQAWHKMVQDPSGTSAITRVHDDLTEAVREAERAQSLKDAGFPVHLSALDQVNWVLRQDEFPPVGNLLS